MTYEQKLHALNSISQCAVLMRQPGDWYVNQNVEIKRGPVLVGEYGEGTTPQAAIEDHWSKMTDLPVGEYLVRHANGSRVAVRWNGFMWDHINEPERSK